MPFLRPFTEDDEVLYEDRCFACGDKGRWITTRGGDVLCTKHARQEEARHARDLDARAGSVSV